jgi:hypothetical protein
MAQNLIVARTRLMNSMVLKMPVFVLVNQLQGEGAGAAGHGVKNVAATKDGFKISANNLEDRTARYFLQDILKPKLATKATRSKRKILP